MYLLPQPMKMTKTDGVFRAGYRDVIAVDGAMPASEKQCAYEHALLLQGELEKAWGFAPPIRRESAEFSDARIFLTCTGEGECEGYTLSVKEDRIVIAGNDSAGLLYGIQTLRQMIRQAGAVIPCVEIEDAPKIGARGLSYDITRGRVPTLEEMKHRVDLCSFYKMNQIQLYVEHSYLFRDFSEMWRHNTPLTAEEILELDAYCKKRHVELVPSLASFGHLYEVLHTKSYAHLCELENADKEPYSLIHRMGHHTVDVSNEESFVMVANRIREFGELFSSKYFNICADETFDLCKGRSRKLGEEKGVKQVYLDFLKRLCAFLEEQGKIPMFWGDVLLEQPELLPEMPKDSILLNWEYGANVTEDNVKKLAEAGVENLYLCPGVQSWNHLINKHSDAYLNISGMCRNAHKYHALGVLNTEWGDLGHIAHPEFSAIGIIYGAAFSWSDAEMSEEEINRAISRLQYGDATGEVVSLFRELADMECVNWWHAVQYKEAANLDRIIFLGAEMSAEEICAKAKERLSRNRELIEELYARLADVPEKTRREIYAYILMGEGQILLTQTGLALYEVSQQRKPSFDCKKLAAQWENWLPEYCKLWRSVSKESELFRLVEVICWYADRLREN